MQSGCDDVESSAVVVVVVIDFAECVAEDEMVHQHQRASEKMSVTKLEEELEHELEQYPTFRRVL